MLAAQAIQCGDADVIVAGGMENMSFAPYYLEKGRWGHRMGPGKIDALCQCHGRDMPRRYQYLGEYEEFGGDP